MAEISSKRRHSDSDHEKSESGVSRHMNPASLSHPISPPRKKRAKEGIRLASPFRLTRIKDLSDEDNIDAVSLSDLVGDPLIAELWDFNYLHDIGFLMRHLDSDTRALTKVHVVHGFWKREDSNRLLLEVSAIVFKAVRTQHTAHYFWTCHGNYSQKYR